MTTWSNKTIGELCHFSNGYGFRPSDWSKDGLPIIRIQNLNGSKEFNYFNGTPDESWLVEPGTILFAWAGTRGVSFGPTIWSGPRGVLNQHIYRIHPYKGVEPLWLYLALEVATKNIEQNAHGFKATLLHVRKEEITSQVIPFPPTKSEQIAIANVLSDINSLIESLDKLIAKKRDIKQATMQQLLTGKTRLLGFSGEWKIKKVGEIAPLQRGFDLPTSQLREGIYPVVYSNGVLNHHSSFKVKAPGVVTGRSGTIGKVNYIEDDYWPHNTSLWVTDFKDNFPKFIYYMYISIKLERFGTGSGVPTMNRNDVHTYSIAIPPFLEQQAIATVLSDMDAEITALEQKRDKTRALKQGMMQELLTGKTRLV